MEPLGKIRGDALLTARQTAIEWRQKINKEGSINTGGSSEDTIINYFV